MTSRRQFLGASAAGLLTAARSRGAKTFSDVYPFAEFESRIAKRDFRDMTKDLLPTPCMVVDLDMFKANVKHMADTAKAGMDALAVVYARELTRWGIETSIIVPRRLRGRHESFRACWVARR